MSISDDSIEDFRIILEKEHGRKVTFKEARLIGSWLIRFYGNLQPHEKGIGYTQVGKQEHSTDTSDNLSK